MPQKAYNATIFIIAVKANKVNLDVMPFPDSWAQIRFFLGIIPASLLGYPEKHVIPNSPHELRCYAASVQIFRDNTFFISSFE